MLFSFLIRSTTYTQESRKDEWSKHKSPLVLFGALGIGRKYLEYATQGFQETQNTFPRPGLSPIPTNGKAKNGFIEYPLGFVCLRYGLVNMYIRCQIPSLGLPFSRTSIFFFFAVRRFIRSISSGSLFSLYISFIAKISLLASREAITRSLVDMLLIFAFSKLAASFKMSISLLLISQYTYRNDLSKKNHPLNMFFISQICNI